MSSLTSYYEEERPWGSFERFIENEKATVKLLHIAPGKRFSLQRHAHRSEYWRVLAGSGRATLNSEVRELSLGDDISIPAGSLHRLEGGSDGITVLEIISGDYNEGDIERVEDDYGRV